MNAANLNSPPGLLTIPESLFENSKLAARMPPKPAGKMPAPRRSAGILARGFTVLPSSVFPTGVFKHALSPDGPGGEAVLT
jgi:hypothetical protein